MWAVVVVTQSLSCDLMDCGTPGFLVNQPPPGACSNSCPMSWRCHPTISSSVVPFSRLQSSPASGSFPTSRFFASGGQSIGVSASACLSNEYSGLLSIRMECLDLLTVQGTLKGLPQHHSWKASILWCSAFFRVQTLTSIHDYWKNHSFDYTDLCWENNVSAF